MENSARPGRRLRIVVPGYPAFNIYSRIARKTTALGPVCVASIVSKMPGWEVEVIDENNFHRSSLRGEDGMPDHGALQELRKADVAAIYGGLSSTIPRVYQLAKIYKEMGVPTLAGGQHFASETLEEGLLNSIDTIVLGEAEETIQELLPLVAEGKDFSHVHGIAFLKDGNVVQTTPRPPLEYFDHYPIPDFSLVRYARITLYPVSRVRGCGMDCEFCTVKGRARCASPERLMEQFMAVSERWNGNDFFIVDDLFGQDRTNTLRLCRMLKEYQAAVGRKFYITVQIRLDKARDAELLAAMREAGVRVVAVGFESPIPEELSSMKKHLNAEEMVELTRVFHKNGFLVHGMFIFGYPLAKGAELKLTAKEHIKYFRDFIRKAKIDTIQVLLPVPLPGTEMTRRLHEDNRVFSRKEIGWEYYDGNFPLFIPDAPLTPEDMQMSIKKIMSLFYRFKYMFSIAFYTLSFPLLVFWLHNLPTGWRIWYKEWRNSLMRFGGWIILRNWKSQFKRGVFTKKLNHAMDEKARHA